MTPRAVARSLVVGLALFAGSAAIADQDSLKFRGVGDTRKSLDALQLKPFSADNWSHLKDWSGEFKPDAAAGKVVMIVTWAAWRTQSHPAMRTAQSIATQFKDKDLVVVAVHNPRGFDQAASSAKDLGVTFPFASDPDGKFRAAIKADADPNVYFIDRAGQLRFAQVEPASAEAAATMLLAETSDQAKGILGDMAARKAAADKERFRTGDASALSFKPAPPIEFQQPDDEAYKAAKWPYLVGKIEEDSILNRVYDKPPKLILSEENWFPSKPNWSGRLLVVYIVDPLDTNDLNILPTMNAFAVRHQKDVVVAGSTFKFGVNENPQGEELQKLIQRNTPAIQSIIAQNRLNHSMTAERARAEDTTGLFVRNNKGKAGDAFAVIVSTDMIIRWVGNPYDKELVSQAIEKLLAVDPGVAARRKAEANPAAAKPKD
jgi:hypothetical protein